MAQLECAMQKQANSLSELQTLPCTDRVPPQFHRLAARVEGLEMQLAELCSQVQADDQARELLNRLSGAPIKPHPPPPPTPFPQTPLFATPVRLIGPSCIFKF